MTNRNSIEADIAGELAADSETEPEKLMQVDRALGWGQITCSLRRWQHRLNERPLFGEGFILCPPVELAPTRGEAWQHAFTIEVVSRRHRSDPPKPTATRRPERHKTRNEPSMNSEEPNERSKQLTLWDEFVEKSQNIQRDDSTRASIEKSALGENHALMEEIVDEIIIEMAWARAKANRGAPGPDGITLEEFPEWFRPQWETVRQQLLDAMYRPETVRRVSIDKPGGGTRELGIPNLLDRVQHDVLMSRVARMARKVRDKRLLKLIGRYLRFRCDGRRFMPTFHGRNDARRPAFTFTFQHLLG